MAKKAYCAACGREVWLGRDGCQFGHPASQLSSIRDVDPKAVAPASSPTAAPARPAVPQRSVAAPPARAVPPVPPQPFAAPAATAVAPFTDNTVMAAEAAPVDAAWDNTPDDFTGPASYGFDYLSLPSDVSIGDTDCLVRRSVARLLDNMLSGILSSLAVMPIVLSQIAAIQAGSPPRISAAPYLISFALGLAYFIALPLVWQGRTLGKALLGIAVTDLKGQPPSIGKLIVRELAMIIDGLFYGIVGLVIASKSPRAQRIGDVWAETVVVRTR